MHNITAESFLRMLHRIRYIITTYVKHEEIDDDYIPDLEIEIESDESTIGVNLYKYDRCGDRESLGYLDITPAMIEDPDGELNRLFAEREKRRRVRKEEEKAKIEAAKKVREETREKRDRSEYERLKGKYKDKE